MIGTRITATIWRVVYKHRRLEVADIWLQGEFLVATADPTGADLLDVARMLVLGAAAKPEHEFSLVAAHYANDLQGLARVAESEQTSWTLGTGIRVLVDETAAATITRLSLDLRIARDELALAEAALRRQARVVTYAEERDSWSPSYRARVDSKLRVSDGAEQRVRRADGEDLVATWEEGRNGGGYWLDAEGQPIDDVTHVYLGPRVGGESGPSGPSGATLSEARRRELGYGSLKLRLPLDTLEHLAELAHAAGLSRAEEAAEIIDESWRAWKRKRRPA